MKNYMFFLCFLLLAGFGLASGQEPILQWNQKFTFGGSSDEGRAMTMDSAGNFYVAGIETNEERSAAVSKFSPDRTQLWTVGDTTGTNPFVWDVAFSEPNQLVLSGTSIGYVIAYDTTGNEKWRTFVETMPLVQAYGDSILAITTINNVRAIIMDASGNISREFLILPYSRYLHNVKIINNFMWIFGGDYDGVWWNAGIFVSKFDILTSELIWTYHLPDGLPASGDVDEEGNAYLGASRLVIDTLGTNKVFLTKIDPSGTMLWETSWFPNKDGQANFETYMNAVTVSDIRSGNRQVVIAGQTQKYDIPEHIVDRDSYMAGLDATTGDTLWTRKWAQVAGERGSVINDGMFDSKNRLIVMGDYYFYPSFAGECFFESYEIPGITLGVKELPLGIPERFALSQNYPNPFNPKTLIRFEIPSAMDVKLTVYNVLGEEVAVLVDSRMNPSVYEADWDASGLPSGVYFYRIRTETFTETKRMMLLK